MPPVAGYFKAVQRVCRKHGALLILDEIMSGMGRIGSLHAWQHPDIDVVPDIQTMGKALGGGYMPAAAVLVNKGVVNVFQQGSGAFGHGQTYQGHPVACRAAVEVQKEIRENNLVENVKFLGEVFGRELTSKLEDCPYVGNVRGKGLFWGVRSFKGSIRELIDTNSSQIEFVKNKSTKEPFDPIEGVAMSIHEKGRLAMIPLETWKFFNALTSPTGMQRPYNISLYPGTGSVDGEHGDHILVSPAFNVTKEEIERIVDLTARVIEDFFTEKFRKSY